MPNVILFQVEEGGQNHIIGGYSSHSWSPNITGDSSSFIFNMTDNLRFNAIEKLAGDFYTKTEDVADYEDESDDRENEESQDYNTWESQKKLKTKGSKVPVYNLSFGETEFVIKDDFATVSSDFKNSYQFALNGDPLQIDKLRSVINHSKRYKPTKMEIWVFEEAPAIFNYD